MHKIQRLYLTTILCLGISTPAWAEDLFVISHPNMVLTSENIRAIFLGEKQFAGSTKIIPVDNNAAQAAFLSQVIKIDHPRYDNSWTKKAFRDGLAQPSVMSGDTEVTHFVKSTPGSVGYVTSLSNNGVTVIKK
jgi:ABC-type phosphate transport system substrate-binding protein